jgi:N-acetyl-1-D-myo-inositol-2-amino-2-deoxy-alpha-D-glucopyranoside deacetylase
VVTTAIDGGPHMAAKIAAMQAHATQIALDGPFYALSNNIGMRILDTEYYRLVQGDPCGPFDPQGHETDLFAGIRAR